MGGWAFFGYILFLTVIQYLFQRSPNWFVSYWTYKNEKGEANNILYLFVYIFLSFGGGVQWAI